MTSRDEEQIKSTELPQKTSQEVKKNQEKNLTNARKKTSLMATIPFLVAILALITSGFTVNAYLQVQKKLTDEKIILTTQIDTLKKNQIDIEKHLGDETSSIQKSQQDLQDQFNQLNNQLQTAMSQRLYQNQDWLLMKAKYYLEMAQINSHWSNSYNATIALLQEADNLLKQVNDQKILAIRQAIAKEILQFKQAATVDTAGILSQLDAAQNSVSNLTIQAAIDISDSDEENQTPKNSSPSVWRTRLQESMNLLEKLVIIRRDNEEFKPLMSPIYESIIRENIRLNLQEAQWAVLNNNPAVYQLALKQAIMNIKRVFHDEKSSASQLIQQLTDLERLQITPEKPVSGFALPLLNQMIDKKDMESIEINKSNKEAQ